MKRFAICLFTSVAIAAFCPTAMAAPPAAPKKVISTAAQIPTPTVQIAGKPSEIVLNQPAQVESFRLTVAAYTNDLLTNYDITDPATRKGIIALAGGMAMAGHEWDKAMAYSAQARDLENKPAAKAMAGLMTRAYAETAKQIDPSKPEFADLFIKRFAAGVDALDWSLTSDSLKAMRTQYQLMSRNLVLGSLASIDRVMLQTNNKLTVGELAVLVGARRSLVEILPLAPRIAEVLDKRISRETSTREDRWTGRLVDLAPGDIKQPVVVAIWDAGTDTSQFPGQLWTNPRERINGRDDDGNGFVDDVNGIAFDPDYRPTTGLLRPMTPAEKAKVGDNLAIVKGSLDMQAGVDSPEAAQFRAKMTSIKPEDLLEFQLEMARMGLYLHGTTTGWTSVVGNPGARILVDRFDAHVDTKPHPIDERQAAAFARYVQKSVDYFRKNKVRVVNMSWRMTQPMINASLFAVDTDEKHRKARADAIFATMSKAMEKAVRSAPEILFVAGAGNENENIGFTRSLPAGLDLPNLMTVGAVDSALKPSGFTSYGSSIDIYANGFEIPSKVPGGSPINISGTSLSAPQVTNLAAKLLALKPTLTIKELRAIIDDTSTIEGDKKLKVIDPAAAIAKVR